MTEQMKQIREDIEENHQTAQESYGELSEPLKQKIAWFKDQKIGVIFHWGLYAQAGIVESWQLSEEDDWARKKPWREDLETLRKDYWSLNQSFNPSHFDPDDWAKQVKDAGFRYMLFTTKHHDGFSMYDTKFSDYKVTNQDVPFSQSKHADVFGALANAFRAQEISVGAYYSKPDWHSPLYWVPGESPKGRYASYDPLEKPELWEQYNQFVENQLVEINQNYGDLDILWLDGGWVNTDNHEFLDMATTVEKLRTTQPDLLVVDRTIGGEFENYVTPERKIPDNLPEKAWESNIPLAKNWGYVPNDQYKPFKEILSSLIKIVALGGNVILGVGPKPDGTLPAEAQAIMKELGDWLSIYGEGIYETRPNQMPKVDDQWYLTTKQNEVFAFLVPTSDTVEAYQLTVCDVLGSHAIKGCIDMKTGKSLSLTNGILTVETSEITGVKFILENEKKQNV